MSGAVAFIGEECDDQWDFNCHLVVREVQAELFANLGNVARNYLVV